MRKGKIYSRNKDWKPDNTESFFGRLFDPKFFKKPGMVELIEYVRH